MMNSKIDDLERLAGLHERGVLSSAEFTVAKASLLSSEAAPKEPGSIDAGPEVAKAENSRGETIFPTSEPISETGGHEEASADFPMWAVFRPIRTEDEASSLLKAGYYAAVVASIQGLVFLSKFRVTSDADNVVLVVTLLMMGAALFYAARKVSVQRSVGAAWSLLAMVSCQMFGILNANGFGFGTLVLGATGVIVGVQAVRATRAYRSTDLRGEMGFTDPSL